ncbi:MAG: hypothetical protein ACK4VI_01275 [Alphaproteobacteria bacterium]
MGAFLPGRLKDRYVVANGGNIMIIPVPDYERVSPEIQNKRREIMVRNMDQRLMEDDHVLKGVAILSYG